MHYTTSGRRMEFAEAFLDMVAADERILDRIWNSDEARFKLNGHINRHNCVHWTSENPRVILLNEVNSPGVSVWCAISSEGIIGPVFFDSTVNSNTYLQMLRTEFWPRVRGGDYYFLHNGPPPHFSRTVRLWLDQNFGGH